MFMEQVREVIKIDAQFFGDLTLGEKNQLIIDLHEFYPELVV